MIIKRRIARTSPARIAGLLVAVTAVLAATAAAQTERIIGGSTAPAANWPSMAHIKTTFPENGQVWTSSCGGTVVAQRYVVTAAHCTYGTAIELTKDQITVATGRTDINATDTGQTIGVLKIERHPRYVHGSSSLKYDIALLRLSSNTSAPPMEIAQPENMSSYTYLEGVPNIAGWGWTIPGDAGTSRTTLQEAFAPLRDNDSCAAALNSVATFDPSIMVCAGAAHPGGATTCHGDSGGPLVIHRGSPARQVLWGVVNWGESDCKEGISAFARVSALTSFLRPAVDEVPPPATAAPPPPPPAPVPPAVKPAAAPARTQSGDTVAPRLDRFVIPATIRVRNGRPLRAIRIKLRSSEDAILQIYLQRRSGARFKQLSQVYRVVIERGERRLTLPRSMWQMRPGHYRLRFVATDSADNSRTYHAAIRARRG